MPFSFSHFATSTLAFFISKIKNPPPGHNIIAVPLAIFGSGKYAVSVGCETL